MKLDQFDTKTRANKGVEMELNDIRTGKPAGAFITLLGKDSDEFRAVKDERSRMIAERVSTGDRTEFTLEEGDVMACEMLARCTVAWRELENKDGQIAFSTEAAKALYLQYPAIREQANVFIADRANFVLA